MNLRQKTISLLLILIIFLVPTSIIFGTMLMPGDFKDDPEGCVEEGFHWNENDQMCRLSTEVVWPKSPLTGVELGPETQLHELIAYLYGWGIGMGGVFVFGILIFAGIQHLTSVGNPEKMRKAMSRITSALLGLALLLSSFIILNAINPQLTRIRPVDQLIKEMEFGVLGIDIGALKEPPCEFIRFYGNPGIEGSYQEFEVGEWTIPKKTHHRTERECIEAGFSWEEEGDIGSGVFSCYFREMKEFQSIAGFRKMDDNEFETYGRQEGKTADGRKIVRKNNTYYIQGGSCIVTPYQKASPPWYALWRESTLCGEDLATVYISLRGIRGRSELQRSMYPNVEEETINCIYVENVGEGFPALAYFDVTWVCVDECPYGYFSIDDEKCEERTMKSREEYFETECDGNIHSLEDAKCCVEEDYYINKEPQEFGSLCPHPKHHPHYEDDFIYMRRFWTSGQRTPNYECPGGYIVRTDSIDCPRDKTKSIEEECPINGLLTDLYCCEKESPEPEPEPKPEVTGVFEIENEGPVPEDSRKIKESGKTFTQGDVIKLVWDPEKEPLRGIEKVSIILRTVEKGTILVQWGDMYIETAENDGEYILDWINEIKTEDNYYFFFEIEVPRLHLDDPKHSIYSDTFRISP